jgi:methyltransferase (TIGR00027 family)
MIPGWFYTTMRFFIQSGYAEWRGPGVMGLLVCRDRYIDDEMQRCLQESMEQIVILGAGFDSRAYRFKDLIGNARIFEVDHPATQQVKLERLKAIFGSIPQYVTYVPIDFEQQTLRQRLQECGYRTDLKTLFIWQGVIYYLEPGAADSTLTFIARNSSPGSALIFDYINQSLLDLQNHSEVRNMRRYRGLTGEPLKSGIPDGSIAAYLQSRGFILQNNIQSQELKRLYCTGKNSNRNITSGYAIATAIVAGSQSQ